MLSSAVENVEFLDKDFKITKKESVCTLNSTPSLTIVDILLGEGLSLKLNGKEN